MQPSLDLEEQDQIVRYINSISKRDNIVKLDYFLDLPDWLRELEKKRRHFDRLIKAYLELPAIVWNFIPQSIREPIETCIIELHQEAHND
jgi:hypothetical protein